MPSKPDAVELDVRVTPRSSQNKIERDSCGSIKVWVTAPPTDGQANAAVCELLAKHLGIAKSHVIVVRGETSRLKRLRIQGVTEAEVLGRLAS